MKELERNFTVSLEYFNQNLNYEKNYFSLAQK